MAFNNTLKGKFQPRNPQKYIGDVNNIIFRSSWEKRAMESFDTHSCYLRWGSEEIIVPYISPLDNEVHRYFVDFWVEYRKKGGGVQVALIEVKPSVQTLPPTSKNKNKMINEQLTFAVNQAKWKAASEYCKERGWVFVIFTEKTVGMNYEKKRG